MVPLLFLIGCLERVTGEAVPLDPRFYAGRSDGEGQPADPNKGGTGDGAYADYKGETVHVAGTITAPAEGPIQVDVNEFDASAPGGVMRVGALHLNESGPFELNVPKTVPRLQLQAFQDPDVDGPSEQDPFAELVIDLGDGAPKEPVALVLVLGARGKGGGPGGGAPGSPGGDPNGGQPPGGPPPGDGPVLGDGPRVTVGGTVTASRDLPIYLDFFKVDPEAAGGRAYLFKKSVNAGPWTQELPADLGPLEVEAYQDLTGDSRTGDDPSARTQSPVIVGSENVKGIDLDVP